MTSTILLHGFSNELRFKRWLPLAAISALLVPAAMFAYQKVPSLIVKTGPVQALSMQHLSMGRVGGVQEIDLRVKQSKGHGVRLYLDDQFAQLYAIEQTMPMAKTVTTDNGGQVLAFEATEEADLAVKLSVRPLSWGQHDVAVRADVPGVLSAESTMSQFVVP